MGDYVLQLHKHALRAFSSVSGDLAPSGDSCSSPTASEHSNRHVFVSESKRIEQATGVESKEVRNLLVWRRSNLVLLILFSIFAVAIQVGVLKTDLAVYDATVLHANLSVVYTTVAEGGTDDLSFRNYTARVGRATINAAMVRVVQARYITDTAVLLLTIVAMALMVRALSLWDSFGRSSKYMLLAWLFAFVSPFVVSAVPTRQLVDWHRFETQQSAFLRGFVAGQQSL